MFFFVQAVPILVDGSSQTELKHPKNVYTQYEPRVFTPEEVDALWNSEAMKKFLSKMDLMLAGFKIYVFEGILKFWLFL